MIKTLFTSDTHFNHANIIRYCSRPFSSVLEMNQEMISRWNAVVCPEDTVYHLGDFAMGQASEWPMILKQLNGFIKILIRGGHDRRPNQMLEIGFAEVHEKYEWNGWLLQHRPMNMRRKLLCGHIHEKWLRIDDIINVGVDVWDFTPRTIEELIRAQQSPREYKCRYCGATLQRLVNNIDHHDGKCINSAV
jgi:calcineurin-like phosphoesterase family protein